MNTYSALEASVKLNISKRAVQKRCKKDNIRKKDNKYLITDLVIDGWAKEIESSVPTNVPSNIGTQDGLKNVADIQELNLDEIEAFEFKFKRAADFYRIGKFVFVPNDKFIIQYSPAEYQRLKDEYATAESEIKLGRYKEETFKKLQTSLEEKIEFITEQMNYYMKLADRTLDMQGIALETLSTQTKDHLIQTTVTAKNTDWRKNENKKGK
tara:strand:+ start:3031 stop:3663 length:633 start_codon:yes stop_codon:yes gene_type:complete